VIQDTFCHERTFNRLGLSLFIAVPFLLGRVSFPPAEDLTMADDSKSYWDIRVLSHQKEVAESSSKAETTGN